LSRVIATSYDLLVAESHRFGAVIQDDLLGQPEAEALVEKPPRRRDVARQKIDVIEAPRRNAARHVPLRLILEGRRNLGCGLESLRFPVQFDGMTVGRRHAIRRSVPRLFDPRARDVALGEVRDQPLQRSVVTDAETDVADAGGRVCRQLERVAFVIAPRAQVDGISAACGLVQADD